MVWVVSAVASEAVAVAMVQLGGWRGWRRGVGQGWGSRFEYQPIDAMLCYAKVPNRDGAENKP